MIYGYRVDGEPAYCFTCSTVIPAGIAYTGGWITVSYPSFGQTMMQDFCSWRCAREGIEAHQQGEQFMEQAREDH